MNSLDVDLRRQLVEQLQDLIPEDGCVLTYKKTFEKRVLRALAELFADSYGAINKRLENLSDLMAPLRRRDVYRWQMRGSYPIKEVLAAMEIANGMAAFLEYCRLDTLGW